MAEITRGDCLLIAELEAGSGTSADDMVMLLCHE